ncbi:hypothetical protein EYC84_005856 [Monilinia fructicola]|uniref:Uncharacterized protein n=1 Tax=Monilinia fructicola TaxID=38448 RepID=A0A5M9K0F8_MONFR|nr:hypothetical protein EYC84_005856 [Monilinia fructicola]
MPIWQQANFMRRQGCGAPFLRPTIIHWRAKPGSDESWGDTSTAGNVGCNGVAVKRARNALVEREGEDVLQQLDAISPGMDLIVKEFIDAVLEPRSLNTACPEMVHTHQAHATLAHHRDLARSTRSSAAP